MTGLRRDWSTIDGRSWQTRNASDALNRAWRSNPFLDPHVVELANALAGHRASIGDPVVYEDAPIFNPLMTLDMSQIEDRQSPKPKRRSKPKPRPKTKRSSNPYAGDGRLERPAPRKTKSTAASGSTSIPKQKPKRIVNQGRHDG